MNFYQESATPDMRLEHSIQNDFRSAGEHDEIKEVQEGEFFSIQTNACIPISDQAAAHEAVNVLQEIDIETYGIKEEDLNNKDSEY